MEVLTVAAVGALTAMMLGGNAQRGEDFNESSAQRAVSYSDTASSFVTPRERDVAERRAEESARIAESSSIGRALPPSRYDSRQPDPSFYDQYKTTFHNPDFVESTRKLEQRARDARNTMYDDSIFAIPNKDNYSNFGTYVRPFRQGETPVRGGASALERQFELQSYESRGIVPASAIASSAWQSLPDNNDMTFGVVKVDGHTNMQEYQRQRDVPVTDTSRKLGIFAGNEGVDWKKKREKEAFFQPNEKRESALTYARTAMHEVQRDRIIKSVAKQNERPFEPEQVTPGVGLKPYEKAKHALRGTDTHRELPPNIDQLRSKANPKLVYQPPVLPGQKGRNLPVAGKFKKQGPPKFRVQKPEDWIGGRAAVGALSAREQFNLQLGNRAISSSVFGPASFAGNKATVNKGKLADPKKNNLEAYPMGPEKGAVERTNPNLPSYRIAPNQRHTTQDAVFGANLGGSSKLGTVHVEDEARPTTRQALSNTQLNGFMRAVAGNYASLSDTTRATIREALTTTPLNTFVRGGTALYANLPDEARATLKQIAAIAELNKHVSVRPGTYANQTDPVRPTARQATTTATYEQPIKGAVANPTAYAFEQPDATGREFTHVEHITGGAGFATAPVINYYTADPTQRQAVHFNDVMQPGVASNVGATSHAAANAMQQNVSREEIAQERTPTAGGVSAIPTADEINARLKTLENIAYTGPAHRSMTRLDDRLHFEAQQLKELPHIDARLGELIDDVIHSGEKEKN